MSENPRALCFFILFILTYKGVRFEWAGPDSNRGPNDYESLALTAELPALWLLVI